MSKKKNITEIQLIENGVRVTLSWIGEGYNGDYDPNDKSDAPLLRMDVDAHKRLKNPNAEDGGKEWQAMNDASYCTNISAYHHKTAQKALRVIMDEVKDHVIRGDGIKRRCESLSWLSKSNINQHFLTIKK
jgi:hypothetical protein